MEECREHNKNRHRRFPRPKNRGNRNCSDQSTKNNMMTGTQHSHTPTLPYSKHSKTTAYIGIGSNLEDKRRNCLTAIERIEQIPGSQLTGCSDWYLTRPVGVKGQEWYVNGVVSLSTKIHPRDLLRRLLAIESDMGRIRRERWESRIIDLDILLYGREIINEEDLTVPHPLMHLRKFVLVPLVQLAPDLIHPSLGVTMAELLGTIQNNGQEVVPLKD